MDINWFVFYVHTITVLHDENENNWEKTKRHTLLKKKNALINVKQSVNTFQILLIRQFI